MLSAMQSGRRFALLAAALTIASAIMAAQLYAGYRLRGLKIAFAGAFALELTIWQGWAVAGPLVWNLEARWPLDAPNRRASLLRHAVAAVAVAVMVLAVALALYHALIRLPIVATWLPGLDRSLLATIAFYGIAYFYVELLIYAGIVAAAYAVRTNTLLRARERETLRLQTELTGAKLTALRMQLQPHFLFNTLHTIGSLILQRQNDRAVQLLAELGELLRATLAHRDTDLARFQDELASLRRYLRIEEARFGDRLRIEWDIDPAAEHALVPAFIMQPLVENAFRHGIAHRTDDSLLRISAAAQNGSVRVTIYNDGPPLPDAFSIETAGGYGLKNVLDRLRTRNPAGALELVNGVSGVRATLVLPRWSEDANARP